jgi:pimeloyl-ACP methyl ester carboxylesterase
MTERTSPAPQPREHYLDLSLGRCRYLEAGSGTPLFLLHGMSHLNSAETFDEIMPELARQHRVIAVDLLGFGKGTREVEAGPTFELMLEQLRELMDHLGIARAAFAGHSMGGWTAMLLAYQSPERVSRLVLLNSAGLNAQISPSVGALAALPPYEKLVEQVKREFRNPARATEARVAGIARTRQEVLAMPNALRSLDPLLHIMQTPTLRPRYMLHRRLAHISAPTLVIWGAGDVIDPYPTWTAEYESLAGDMRRSTKPWTIPGARYVLMQTGHYSHWEEPERVAELIRTFLA